MGVVLLIYLNQIMQLLFKFVNDLLMLVHIWVGSYIDAEMVNTITWNKIAIAIILISYYICSSV